MNTSDKRAKDPLDKLVHEADNKTETFEAQKKQLQESAARLENGMAKTYTVEEAKAILEATIQRAEVQRQYNRMDL